MTIVTYKGYDKAFQAISTLLRHTKGVILTVYAVDNASGDMTAQRLKEEFPSIQVIENSKNKGFGYGHNTVIPLLDSDYHVVVNPDITIDRDVITELTNFMEENPNVGMVTPKICNLDGSDQQLPKRYPTVLALLGRRMFTQRLKKQVEYYQMKDKDLVTPQCIEYATGCFFMIRTGLFLQLEGFDKRFFLYYEDIDISRRAGENSDVVYYPGTYVYHAWERSSAHKLKYFLILVIGMFKYFNKWGWKLKYKGID